MQRLSLKINLWYIFEKNSVDFDLTDSFFNLFRKDYKKVWLICLSII